MSTFAWASTRLQQNGLKLNQRGGPIKNDPFHFKYLILLPLISLLCQACHPSSGTPDNKAANAPPDTAPLGCPANYVLVPGNTDFGVAEFCVAKYEAKQVSGLPESQAAEIPWTNLTRDQAESACEAKGSRYALLDNNHWMTIARNIESVSWNSGGDASLSEFGLSRGITNNNSTTSFPASTDDNESCFLATKQSGGPPADCDLNTYDVARRVHKLSNDSLLWDFAGNASEWISDDLTETYNVKTWVLNLTDVSFKSAFGPSGNYPAGPTNPTGNIYMSNFGYLNAQMSPPYVIFRGGGFNYGRYAGVYTAYFVPTTKASADIGFRCYYQP